jgi:hypothetical protein
MNSNRSPFSTAELLELPRNAYAFRNRFGVWGIRQDAQTVNATIANGNSETLTASDYYATPVDALVVAEIVSRSFTVAQHIDKAYNG